ncbi:hypothetical protein CLAFUR0_04689 [Fulvia fulva]|nr:hypothetical protein CLAFUR0_04689 [Fulvia fulva]
MAAAVIDIKAQATFPIRLGASILKPSKPSSFTSVRYNHKPRLEQANSITAKISKGDDEGESELSLKNGDGEYQYKGRHTQDENTYVLVLRGQGKDKEMLLERMNGGHNFNLVSTPAEGDAGKLAEKYPPLPLEDEEGDLFGEDDEDTPPDDSNPFDYRHFLKAELEKSEATNVNIDAVRSPAITPLPRAQPVASTSANRGVKKAVKKPEPLKKRKTNAAEKANPKRVKAGQEPPAPATAAKPKPKAEVPNIHMDRKASVRRESVAEDDGLLVIEDETPTTEKPSKHGAMALALSGQLGSGPISLRSAANSPGGSHASSPMPARPEANEEKEQYVFEFDDDAGSEPADDEGADADEEDDDADVDEDIELPSPTQPHRPSISAAVVTGGGDDDDDLEAQLAAGLMEDDDGGAQESEESEEE